MLFYFIFLSEGLSSMHFEWITLYLNPVMSDTALLQQAAVTLPLRTPGGAAAPLKSARSQQQTCLCARGESSTDLNNS